MKALLVGCGNRPASFLSRLIHTLRQEGIEVENFDQLIHLPRWRRQLVAQGMWVGAPRKVRRVFTEFDVIHFQWPGHYAAWRILAIQSRRPVVLSLRGRQLNILPWLPGNGDYRKQLGKHLREVTILHCVSDNMATVAASLGGDPKKVRVIRPAIDTAVFSPADNRDSGKPQIAMVGALMWRKGYEHAFLAIRELMLRGHEFRLSVAGEGPDRRNLEFMIRALGLGECVRFVGDLSEPEVIALLQNSDIFLHTSLSEGLANSVLEAMACGLPVVTTDVGGMKEAVQNGRNGLLVPARDHIAIADALVEFLERPRFCREAGLVGRKLAVQNFGLADQGRKFADLYSEAIS